MSDGDILDLSDDELLALPRPPCPRCRGRDTLVPRVYGMPDPADPLMQRVERGEVDVEFAGCIIPLEPLPVWRCRQCDALVSEDGALIDKPGNDE